MNNNPTYQQSVCATCAASIESSTETTWKRDDNETITTANDTVRLVPELRFPQFQNAGEWQPVTLKEVGKTYSGLSGKSGEDFGIGEPYVTYKQVFSGASIKIDECPLVAIKKGEKQNKLKKGDILVTISSETAQEIGMVNVITEDLKKSVYLNSFCFIFRPQNNCFIPSFAKYLFNTSSYRKQITSIAQGITRYNLSKDNFLKLKLSIPSPQEQQKIASCLLSIDDEIATTKQKLEQLKTHKKALLQKLFPQRGKTVPELRFPEFQNTGEWQENMVGDAIKTLSPSKKLQSKEYKTIGKIPIIDQSQAYICGYSDDASAVLNRDSEELIIFGDHTCTLKLVNFPFIQGADGIKIFRSKNQKKLDTKFVYYMLLHIHIKPVAYKRHFMELKSKKLLFPPLLHEQKKIANVLQSIDDEIFATTNKLALLKSQKDALLQQLFPHI